MVGNLALLRLARPRWAAHMNLQFEPAALYIGVVPKIERTRLPIGLAPDPKLPPPAVAVTQFDLWIHPLPVIGLHIVVWRVAS